MNELVTVTNGENVTNTLIIAEGAQNSHKAVIQLVRKYQKDLEEVGGQLTFEMGVVSAHGAGQKTEYALLDEPQTTLLFTFMQNTEIVRAFKVKLVKAFYQMRQFGTGQLHFEHMLNTSPSFNKVVQGVVNMSETLLPHFTTPRKVMNTEAVQEFIGSQCELDHDSYCTKTALHKAFAAWCDATDAGIESKPNFFAKLYRCHPAISQGRILVDGVRTPIVTGIALESN